MAEVRSPALDRRSRGIDTYRAPRAAGDRSHREGARVREQVRDALALRGLAHPPSIGPLVEKKTRRQPVAEANEVADALLEHADLVRGGASAHGRARGELRPPRVDEGVRLPRTDLEIHPVHPEPRQGVEHPRAARLRPEALVFVELRDEVFAVEI